MIVQTHRNDCVVAELHSSFILKCAMAVVKKKLSKHLYLGPLQLKHLFSLSIILGDLCM